MKLKTPADLKSYSCEGKERMTADVAKRAAKRIKGRHAYQCEYCGSWHVGTRISRKTFNKKKPEVVNDDDDFPLPPKQCDIDRPDDCESCQ